MAQLYKKVKPAATVHTPLELTALQRPRIDAAVKAVDDAQRQKDGEQHIKRVKSKKQICCCGEVGCMIGPMVDLEDEDSDA